MNGPETIIINNENDPSLTNILKTNTKQNRKFGQELHNKRKNEFTPKSKKIKMKEEETPETRCRAITSLKLCKPAFKLVEDHYDNINSYLLQKDSTNQIKRDYMNNQKDLNSKMRSILIDWLVDVHLKFELAPQTYFCCVQLLDRFLEKKEIERTRLQLVGICCLMIVSKIEEIYSPMVKDYLAVCDNAYSRSELLEMESDVLSTLNFSVISPNSYDFLANFNAKIQLEEKLFYYSQFVLETAFLDMNYLKHTSALLTAGAIFFTNKLFKREGWSAENERISGITENQLKGAAKDLFIIMQKVEKGELKAISKKFADGQFFEVSKYTIQKNPS